jgi:UDP-2,3-diacylglucosamine hydrolase
MGTIFISDLHLDDARKQTTAQFLAFLESHCMGIDALYILGDLFEAWIGDDDDAELAMLVKNALIACRASGTRLFIQRGNRDFMLGEAFAAEIGAQLLADHVVIDCLGEPTLLMHGDLLCTRDTEYLAFRAQAHNPLWQAQMLSQPLPVRRAIAENARQASMARQQQLIGANQLDAITDVTPGEVIDTMRRFGVRRLIHGHTHRPARHALDIDGQPAERIVLGDWYTQESHLSADENGLTLSYRQAG